MSGQGLATIRQVKGNYRCIRHSPSYYTAFRVFLQVRFIDVLNVPILRGILLIAIMKYFRNMNSAYI